MSKVDDFAHLWGAGKHPVHCLRQVFTQRGGVFVGCWCKIRIYLVVVENDTL
jgi:hypothetical protein